MCRSQNQSFHPQSRAIHSRSQTSHARADDDKVKFFFLHLCEKKNKYIKCSFYIFLNLFHIKILSLLHARIQPSQHKIAERKVERKKETFFRFFRTTQRKIKSNSRFCLNFRNDLRKGCFSDY